VGPDINGFITARQMEHIILGTVDKIADALKERDDRIDRLERTVKELALRQVGD
jgi:hypothetical protein